MEGDDRIMPLILTQNEYDRLMQLRKTFDSCIKLPMDDEKVSYTLHALDSSETFLLNIERKRIFEIRRSKLNTSFSKEPILRVEVDGRPHINPDGERIGRNHIHIYKQGYGLSWAYPLETFSDELFKDATNFNILFSDFCKYSNIEFKEVYQGVL